MQYLIVSIFIGFAFINNTFAADVSAGKYLSGRAMCSSIFIYTVKATKYKSEGIALEKAKEKIIEDDLKIYKNMFTEDVFKQMRDNSTWKATFATDYIYNKDGSTDRKIAVKDCENYFFKSNE